jgi:hypothetical protein
MLFFKIDKPSYCLQEVSLMAILCCSIIEFMPGSEYMNFYVQPLLHVHLPGLILTLELVVDGGDVEPALLPLLL